MGSSATGRKILDIKRTHLKKNAICVMKNGNTFKDFKLFDSLLQAFFVPFFHFNNKKYKEELIMFDTFEDTLFKLLKLLISEAIKGPKGI